MADFKTKITADGKQFNDEMNKAAQKGKSFERQIQETSKGMNAFTNKANILASAIKAMPFVAAGAAIAGFAKKGLEATQASDGMRNTMAALNTTVTSFFGSIMSGDWSAFNNGITEAFNNAKRFREAMDSLGDALLSKKIFDAEIMDEYTAALADASDMSLSLEDRQKALASAQASVAKMTENNVHVAQRLNTSLSALWKQETGQEFTEETIREVSKAGDVYDDLAAKINNAATKIRNASLTVSQSSVGASSSYSKTIQQAREEAIELLATQNEGSKEQLRLASLWQNFNDKERQQNAELLIQYSNQNREINQMERGLIRLSNRNCN